MDGVLVADVRDGPRQFISPWIAEPLNYDALTACDVGRRVIYRGHKFAEVGTLTSWRNGVVYARYSLGDTAAGAKAEDVMFGLRSLDTPAEILEAIRNNRWAE